MRPPDEPSPWLGSVVLPRGSENKEAVFRTDSNRSPAGPPSAT